MLAIIRRHPYMAAAAVLVAWYMIRPAAAATPASAAAAANSPPNYDAMTFAGAFAMARAAGMATFVWRGNRYSTALK